MPLKRFICWTPLALAAGASFAIAATAQVTFDVTVPPARTLTAGQLFRDVARQIPNEGLIPFTINTPLFSDYAEKHRFLYLPPGETITWREEGALALPVGAVLVKTFGFLHDRRVPEGGERIVETRLLTHRPEGWVGYPYVWNESLTEARLAVAGARIALDWLQDDGTRQQFRYTVPNMNQCKQCHGRDGVIGPIGFVPRQLDRPEHGEDRGNQLATWIAQGVLPPTPENMPRRPLPVWNDPATGTLDQRARAYLEANCAHCHNPGGEGASTGLDLRWEQHEPVAYGVKKQPTAAGPASRGYLHAIHPGAPDRSFLLNRMRATDPVIMMPRTGRTLVHREGVALIEAWIAGMDPTLRSPDLATPRP